MRTHLRRHFHPKKFLSGLAFSLILAGSLWGLIQVIPLLNGCGQTLSILSAAAALPQGTYGWVQSLAPAPTLTAEAPSDTKSESETDTMSESTSASILPESLPDEPDIPNENKATLVHKTYTAAPSTIYIPLENGFIKNCTRHTAEEIQAAISGPLPFTIEKTDEPQVLIMHTHTTESYFPFTGDYYDKTYSSRSTDNTLNMVAVGNCIEAQLKAAGIGVLHDTTQHDYPSFNGAYDRSAVTVQKYLKEYPSIKVVLDVHRDAIVSGDTVTAPVAEINGKTAAQVMIVNGCANENINYPNFFQNLSFAAALENQLEGDYPGLTRPVLFDYRKYNQHLTTGSILLEVGGHGNTLEQACYSGECIGRSLGKLLTESQN